MEGQQGQLREKTGSRIGFPGRDVDPHAIHVCIEEMATFPIDSNLSGTMQQCSRGMRIQSPARSCARIVTGSKAQASEIPSYSREKTGGRHNVIRGEGGGGGEEPPPSPGEKGGFFGEEV